ncbi:hypothetical protein [Flavobacterium lacus]|uniref:Lipoprotein n=1 Tax=Flavobacterium lacus TaxID=1353778 RepID=A0A328WXF0_9FLAO|nr:hypothetical protein [Flavobacterium lacus]RAR51030.1 hypothetical protein B0I10_101203 [Flavobacterium lacus]
MIKITLLKKSVNCVLGCAVMLLISCKVGPKANSNKGVPSGNSSKYTTSFFLEGGESQYYVKPLKYTSTSSKKVYLDFVYKTKSDTLESGLIYLSLFQDQKLTSTDLKEIKIGNISLKNRNHLYTEFNKGKYELRVSLPVTSDELKQIQPNLTIELVVADELNLFLPDKKTIKVLNDVIKNF